MAGTEVSVMKELKGILATDNVKDEPIDVFSEDVHGTPEEQETTEETSEEGK